MDKDTMLKNMKLYALHSKNIENNKDDIETKLNNILEKNINDLNVNLYPIIQNQIMDMVHSRKFIFGFTNRYNNTKDLFKKNNITKNEDKVRLLMTFFKNEKKILKEKLHSSVIEKVTKDVNFHLFYLNDIKSSCNRMPPKTISTSIKMRSRNNNHVLIGDKDCEILGYPLNKDCKQVGILPEGIERPPYLNKYDISVCDFDRSKIESAEETERQRLAKMGITNSVESTTTIEPTTTTIEPTTTTIEPTTLSPSTLAPSTLAPSTLSPSTLAPSTLAPKVEKEDMEVNEPQYVTTLSPFEYDYTTVSPV